MVIPHWRAYLWGGLKPGSLRPFIKCLGMSWVVVRNVMHQQLINWKLWELYKRLRRLRFSCYTRVAFRICPCSQSWAMPFGSHTSQKLGRSRCQPAANSHQQPAAASAVDSCDTRGLEFEAPLGRQSHGVLVCGHWLHRPLAMLDGQWLPVTSTSHGCFVDVDIDGDDAGESENTWASYGHLLKEFKERNSYSHTQILWTSKWWILSGCGIPTLQSSNIRCILSVNGFVYKRVPTMARSKGVLLCRDGTSFDGASPLLLSQRQCWLETGQQVLVSSFLTFFGSL